MCGSNFYESDVNYSEKKSFTKTKKIGTEPKVKILGRLFLRKVKSKIIRRPARMLMSDFQSQFSMSKTASESFQDDVMSSFKTFSLSLYQFLLLLLPIDFETKFTVVLTFLQK